MFVVETEVFVERAVAEVFDFLADQTNAPKWQRDLDEVQRLTSGALRVGTEHEFIRTFAGRRIRQPQPIYLLRTTPLRGVRDPGRVAHWQGLVSRRAAERGCLC